VDKLVDEEQKDRELFDDKNNKSFHCREMIGKFIQSDPQIRSISFVEVQAEGEEGSEKTGDISFSVFMNDMGFNKELYLRYEKEFFSTFMINFFGEFLVRENISDFVSLTKQIEPKQFIDAISSKVHRKFGVQAQGNVVTFTFHISLLSNILTEDLRTLDW